MKMPPAKNVGHLVQVAISRIILCLGSADRDFTNEFSFTIQIQSKLHFDVIKSLIIKLQQYYAHAMTV